MNDKQKIFFTPFFYSFVLVLGKNNVSITSYY